MQNYAVEDADEDEDMDDPEDEDEDLGDEYVSCLARSVPLPLTYLLDPQLFR